MLTELGINSPPDLRFLDMSMCVDPLGEQERERASPRARHATDHAWALREQGAKERIG